MIGRRCLLTFTRQWYTCKKYQDTLIEQSATLIDQMLGSKGETSTTLAKKTTITDRDTLTEQSDVLITPTHLAGNTLDIILTNMDDLCNIDTQSFHQDFVLITT